MYNRISIVGGSGSGKSTLCNILSKELNLKKKDIEIIRGEKSSKKIISINIEYNILEEYFKNTL